VKAVIPAAGLGVRFLPYTKAQPKEMLPILDKPAIQFVVEEALRSGIRDVLIITGRGKRAIEDHFDANLELERYLVERGMTHMVRELRRQLEGARIAYVRQPRPLGNGHAVLCAEAGVDGQSFAVLLGDDVLLSHVPCTQSLVKHHAKLGASCIAVQRVPRGQVPAYGMVLGEEVEDGVYQVRRIVEKPPPSRVTSDLVTIGRYVFSPQILDHLRKAKPGLGGEIWLTDGIRSLLRSEDVYAWQFEGTRFDIGTKLGWLLANIELAWARPDYREQIQRLLRSIGGAKRRLPTRREAV